MTLRSPHIVATPTIHDEHEHSSRQRARTLATPHRRRRRTNTTRRSIAASPQEAGRRRGRPPLSVFVPRYSTTIVDDVNTTSTPIRRRDTVDGSTESFHLPCSCRSQQSSQLLKSRHRTTSRRIFAALFYLDFEALFYCFILFPRFSSIPWTLPSVQASVTSSVPFCCSILAQVVEARSHRAAPVISFPADTTYDGERLENLSTQPLKVTVRRATE